ncbi:MarR family winged helix-turn-helix transcriptional regulator [Ectobacillus polymachus]|uniref:MarR family winged helix-turn-helix transcriptional regulator n=1 Tax=Ectobacillus polymachus TaxID=1508806 RepID=UPI003A8C02EC
MPQDTSTNRTSEVIQSFTSVNRTLLTFTQQNASSLGLTVPQMGILNTIYIGPSITLKAITEKLALPKSTVSVNVDGLVNLGLVERAQSAEDRREIHVTVTAKGEEAAKASIQNASSFRAMKIALQSLSEEEITTLLRLHSQLLSSLQTVK